MPRGSVHAFIFQTFCLRYFSISAAGTGGESTRPDCGWHHYRNGHGWFGRGDPRRHRDHRKPVSGLKRGAKTDAAGQYKFTNLPFNPYHLVVHAPRFADFTADVPVRSSVAVTPSIKMQVGGASTTVTVTGDDLVENDTSLHTDIDRNLIEKLPLESSSSSVSSLVTLSTPGVRGGL